MTKANESANAFIELKENLTSTGAWTQWKNHKGITKSEYFASIAMQGLLTRVPPKWGNETDLGIQESKRIAEESCIMADALIEELNKYAK